MIETRKRFSAVSFYRWMESETKETKKTKMLTSFVKNLLQKVFFWPNIKSFIDQTCSVKIAGYWPRSFFSVFILRLGHKNAKKDK